MNESFPPRAVIFCPPLHQDDVFPAETLASIEEMLGFPPPIIPNKDWSRYDLSKTEMIFGTWGMPYMDDAFLAAVPNLRAVFYAAGSVKGFVSDALWQRGVSVSSAWVANGVPVSEYTLATILLSLKRFWHFQRGLPCGYIPGGYKSSVGLVSLGAIGRQVARWLAPFDVKVFAYDPFISAADAEPLGVTLLPLDKLFASCHVVSIHTPWIPETVGMINGKLIASMPESATLINTARGAVVNEPEMIAVLEHRSDLAAVLDVSWPEPPASDSPLRTLPNVVFTPHIAGSLKRECVRMGDWMVEEARRYLAGQPLHYSLSAQAVAKMA